MNLFSSERSIFDIPKAPEFSYFDTHFGRVGIFICFDILFKSPAYDLVEKYNVTEIAFPTAWMDALPLYPAVGAHQAWAMEMNVNLLSSNYRDPRRRMLGSGIYSPSGPLIFTRNTTYPGSILLVTRVPRHTAHAQIQLLDNFNLSEVVNTVVESESEIFESELFHDVHRFIRLHSGYHSMRICQNEFCCELQYEAIIPDNEFYALGVFYGLHDSHQQILHMQNCVLIKCANTEHSSCGRATQKAGARFRFFNLEGNFRAKYVFPSVVTNNVQLASKSEFTYNRQRKSITSHFGIKEPLLLAILHGRIYDVTPPSDLRAPDDVIDIVPT